jgi:carbamoyltransferase
MQIKHILGISAGFHDAAVSLIRNDGKIVFAGHSERYSKQKNDADISLELLNEIDMSQVDTVAYYERPWAKQLRQLYSGQGIEWDKLTVRQILERQIGANRLGSRNIKSYNHHLSHAAAGFQTSPYDRATVVVIDAIGEWDTISIWGAEYDQMGQATYRRLWGQRYPHSIGLFYSAITGRVGLHPLDEEYITMGMAAWGKSTHSSLMLDALLSDHTGIRFKNNLHIGLESSWLTDVKNEDIAASAQEVAEQLIYNVMQRASEFDWSNNLVYMGGVALNCLANRNLGDYFDRIWIMPCPGDAGSSLGAAALAYGGRLEWQHPYLGHVIPGTYPVAAAVDHLLRDRIVGVASGAAEFGPRALGNRSLLADPRGPDIKEQVNEIKRRQQFRPFAPVILEEYADQYFDLPRGFCSSPYMQSVARCLAPDLYPAIVHVDGTSRVQTVAKDSASGIRQLLEAWYAATGCPMLLNTSLNIRGEPMVNDRRDADRFEKKYNVKVVS